MLASTHNACSPPPRIKKNFTADYIPGFRRWSHRSRFQHKPQRDARSWLILRSMVPLQYRIQHLQQAGTQCTSFPVDNSHHPNGHGYSILCSTLDYGSAQGSQAELRRPQDPPSYRPLSYWRSCWGRHRPRGRRRLFRAHCEGF